MTKQKTAGGMWEAAEALAAMKKAGATIEEQNRFLDKADREAFPNSYPKPNQQVMEFNTQPQGAYE